MSAKCFDHEAYLVGWVCPLEVELIAAIEMLDEEHETLSQIKVDSNVYKLGSINNHNIVVAGLPVAGNVTATSVVTQMRMTFPNIKYVLLVGIGGAVPRMTEAGMIRLGHVVVSKPVGMHSGAVQYDHGKAHNGQFERTGALSQPPAILLSAAQALAVHRARSNSDPVWRDIQRTQRNARAIRRFKFPGAANDYLYHRDYTHRQPRLPCDEAGCDLTQCVPRIADEMDESFIVVHRGTIASGELLLRDAELRDRLADQDDVLCFEMEAAGMMNTIPCLVIRGISDYCDSHKDDRWHGFAAAAAAAYARQLFFHLPKENKQIERNRPRHTSTGFHPLMPSGPAEQVWLNSTGECINKLEGHTDEVVSVAVSHDSSLIASASADKTVRVWLTSTGECIKSFPHTYRVRSVVFSHNSALIASASVDGVKVWRLSTGEKMRNIGGSGLVAFSHDSTLLASISQKFNFLAGWSQSLNRIHLWRVETGECVKTLNSECYDIYSVAFSHDSKLVTSAEDHRIRIWSTNSGDCIKTIAAHAPGFITSSVACSHDSTLIASGSEDGTIKIWRTSTGDCVKTLDGCRGGIRSLAFSHDSTLIVSASVTGSIWDTPPIRIWRGSSGNCIKTLEGHRRSINSVAFSGDSALIASASCDMTVRLWRAKTANM